MFDATFVNEVFEKNKDQFRMYVMRTIEDRISTFVTHLVHDTLHEIGKKMVEEARPRMEDAIRCRLVSKADAELADLFEKHKGYMTKDMLVSAIDKVRHDLVFNSK